MGGGGSSGGQSAVVTGPTVAAANSAAQAQITAAQMAAQAATENTNSAIQALMGEYTTSMGITNPIVEEGNAAAAQLNYMLGLAPAPLPSAPVAPTAPTLASLEKGVTQTQLQSYIQQNTSPTWLNQGKPTGGVPGSAGAMGVVYNGLGSDVAGQNYVGGVPTQYNDLGGTQALDAALLNNTDVTGAITQNIAQGELNDPNSNANEQYNTAQTLYAQQMNSYNDATTLYNQYTAKGTASPTDIGNIVSNLPGYQYQQSQGINALQNAASAQGQLGGSNMIQNLNTFGQSLAGQYYQNYLGNLQGLAGLGTQAATGSAAQATQTGNAVAGLQSNLGSDIANSYLAAGQAQASAFTSPAANQQIISQSLGGGGGGGSNIGGILSGVGSIAGLFSSYDYKEFVEDVDFRQTLQDLDRLPVNMWRYKGTDESRIGAYAEDFKDVFKVGDGKTINIVDAFGACFGLIKELKKEIDELKDNK